MKCEAVVAEACHRLSLLLPKPGTSPDDDCKETGVDKWSAFYEWIEPTFSMLKRSKPYWPVRSEPRAPGAFIPSGGNKHVPTGVAASCSALYGAAVTPGPAECQALHAVHLQLVRLCPVLAAVWADMKAVVLPAMPWLGAEVAAQLHLQFETAVDVVKEAGWAIGDLAAAIPAKDLCAGAIVRTGILRGGAAPGAPRLHFPTAQQLVHRLLPFLKDPAAALSVLTEETQRFRRRAALQESAQVALDNEIGALGGISAAGAEFTSAVARECCAAAPAAEPTLDGHGLAPFFEEVCGLLDQLEASPSEPLLLALTERLRSGRRHLGAAGRLLDARDAAARSVQGALTDCLGRLKGRYNAAVRHALQSATSHGPTPPAAAASVPQRPPS
ncbi:unnamed protein product [Ostreobium quekettii]|uniref:Uncharacterized protein n=1 Tax=Ostreobium quekettii TaxID=121088 RepID=A0A8S1J7T5_9CHLO|nr:unnamed protein product [Ostreobium quekettii]